ncbi:CPBP family intramembrane glutamic endopeptidase [Clostridium sp. ZS2-4]|uniref:CPBP family intramembrane glutamic endopeptidase n=1 Tax=Clostridium sp. ZS2-4 TaxID=2987703 RepID=UPI00227D213C|nr:CPBP family intramembrane glutamic endopeptidase [Clostridium sp. ZS2-4]MCY6356245.1 CPBP family intramembrane metalloprotease [Clostridium sp. ZS2-4]
MNKLLNKLHNYLKNLSTIKFIAAIVLFTYLIFIPLIPLFYLGEKYIGPMGDATSIARSSLFTQIILTSIAAPILETLIFQYGIIEILNLIPYFKGKNIIITIISALLFGIAHSYSLLYIFFGFSIGLLLAYSYIVYRKKNFSAFWVVFWIHCIRNTISTILLYI